MTSLIDVIFLLLLFFMLTSTFSKFSEVELAAAGGLSRAASNIPPLFLKVSGDDLSLNGTSTALRTLPETLQSVRVEEETQTLLVSLSDEVTAQRLTDVLVSLRQESNLTIAVLGGS